MTTEVEDVTREITEGGETLKTLIELAVLDLKADSDEGMKRTLTFMSRLKSDEAEAVALVAVVALAQVKIQREAISDL